MQNKYNAYTLVDITNSEVTNSKSNNTDGYNQQQNLNTLIQLIGLRSQPIHYSVIVKTEQDLVDYRFGKAFNGLHTVWKFEFVSEHSDVYLKDDDPVHFLVEDCDGVSFTPYLDETVNFLTNSFETKNSELLNIYFLKCV